MASQLPSHREVAPIAMPIPSPPSDSETAHTHDPTRTSSHSQPHRQLASELPPEDMEAFSKNFKRPVFGTLGKYRDHIDRFIDDTSDEMITGLKLHLDNLLIFAALFSAINAGVLVYWLPQLSIGPTEETNKLLRLLVMRVDNTTLTESDLGPPPFSASSGDVRINRLLSISLTISLLASFGTLLAQQWIAHFKRETHRGPEMDRWEKRRRLDGARRWKLETIVELVLPTIMQAALVVFLIGLIDLLGSLSGSVALPNLILACCGAGAFIVSILCSVWDPYCPFQTSLPKILSYPIRIGVTQINDSSSWRCTIFNIFGTLQRPDETCHVLEAKAICTTLRTSSDDAVLLDNARNLPLLSDRAALKILSQDPEVLPRLFFLSHRAEGDSTRTATYGRAAVHLIFAGQPLDVNWQYLILWHWQDATRDCVYDPTNSVSLLPSSFTTFGLMCLPKSSEFAPEVSKRYLDHVCAAFRGSPVEETIITVGMMAWYLTAYSQSLLQTSDGQGVAEATPVRGAETTFHRPHTNIDISDWEELVKGVRTAYSEFQGYPLGVLDIVPLEFLCTQITQALESYYLADLLTLREKDPQGTEILFLDQLAFSILKGVWALYEHYYDKPLNIRPLLQIVGPLFSDSSSPPLLHHGRTVSSTESASIAQQHEQSRNLVYQEALDLVDRVLTSSALDHYIPDDSSHHSPGYWHRCLSSDEARVLTNYIKTLMERPATDGPVGILRFAPRLCAAAPSGNGDMQAEVEVFRTTWLALRKSGRYPVEPEPQADESGGRSQQL